MHADQTPAVAFVGTMVPDDPRFHGPAFNRASQMFQDELVRGLGAAGFSADVIFSLEPMPAFPRGNRLFVRSGSVITRAGHRVRMLPFINLQPLKALTAGAGAFVLLLGWAWRNRGRPRVIHCVNLTMPPGLAILAAARLSRSRALASVLDVWRPGALVPDRWPWRVDFWLQRRLLPRFDGLMVVSKAIADDFVPGRRYCLLDGGIAPDRFHAAPARREPRVPGAPFRVVLCGTLDAYNGVELTLEAFDRLPSGFELIVAGKGAFADAARTRARRDPRISYRGFLPFEQVLDLYWSADLLLNPRLTGALDTRYFFPSKLMELLASGTPVLSTCTGHVETEYGEVLYLLRDETPDALANRIREIAAMPESERFALGRRARDLMFTERTWDKQTARLAQYIRSELLGADGP